MRANQRQGYAAHRDEVDIERWLGWADNPRRPARQRAYCPQRHRGATLKRVYGMSLQDYDLMLDAASAASAPSAVSNPPAHCASITAMSPARCAGSFAAPAISPSASSRTARPACARRPPISRLRSTPRLTASTRIARLNALLRREGAGGAPPPLRAKLVDPKFVDPKFVDPKFLDSLPQAGDQLLAVGEMLLLHIENAREAAFLERQHVDPGGRDPASPASAALGSMPAASQTMSISRSSACRRPSR